MTDTLDNMKRMDNLKCIQKCQDDVFEWLKYTPARGKYYAAKNAITRLFDIIDSYERGMNDDAMERLRMLQDETQCRKGEEI